MLNYNHLMERRYPAFTQVYSIKDCVLYALSTGFGNDPEDERELPFVLEKGTVAVPTMATVLGTKSELQADPDSGIDWRGVVHGEHALTVHAPLPVEGSVTGTTTITNVIDNGAGRGAMIDVRRDLMDTASGTLLATSESTVFCRFNGGFSAHDREGGARRPKPSPLPDRVADFVVEFSTYHHQALLYRWNGDFHPLHAMPDFARAAGFERPILHGLCSLGVSMKLLMSALVDHDATRVRGLRARFTSPIYPGETIRLKGWLLDDGEAAFRCEVVERQKTILDYGKFRFI